MSYVSTTKRTHYCGDLRNSHGGSTVVLMGWVDSRRDHGGLVFVDLRDRAGLVQIVLNPADLKMKSSKDMRNEYVVAVTGKVRSRPEGSQNKKLPTGEVEVEATECEILSEAKSLPFQIQEENVNEMLRLKYRYLDLRSARMQKSIRVRHQLCQIVRQVLSDESFYEIETPILYKSTPEGARDYLVPSRVFPGRFFALPQSPQTLKQLLMISGYDRYFQIARCFRDEDLRADRQPEFTQIDIEMSFVDVEDIIRINEKLLRIVWEKIKGVKVGDIPKMTFQEAMDTYGNDKPDIRFGMKIKDVSEMAAKTDFKVFQEAAKKGGVVRGIAVPKGGSFSRGQFDKLTDLAKKYKAKGLVWIKSENGTLTSPISKFVTPEKLTEIFSAIGGQNGDAVLIVADEYEIVCAALANLRLELGNELNLIDRTTDRFLWVIDFPLLEYSPDEKRWAARHHPFTSPQNQCVDDLVQGREKNFSTMLAKAYDLVCNGHEIAGGSIRIHRNEVQQAMFKCLGMTPEETESKFGFFLEALQYGTPPHGGIAWGVDRMMMILLETDAIREVIAFPKTTKAQCMMSSAPNSVSREQLLELGIRLGPAAEKLLEDEAAGLSRQEN